MDNVTENDAVMGEEIFGPVLPVITVGSMREAEEFISKREKPLALYLFTSSKDEEKRFTRFVSFGGGCINDTVVHLATSDMPFGGVGNSGMGAYHGKDSFNTFSHEKSILKKYCLIDMPMRYQPYKELYLKLIKLFCIKSVLCTPSYIHNSNPRRLDGDNYYRIIFFIEKTELI